MGAAMAPAAADTIKAHFADMNSGFEDLDLVVTGDLGIYGREILIDLLENSGIRVPKEKLIDCGAQLFDHEAQDTHAGGSGCGCIASVSSGWIMNRMEAGELSNVLLVGTGAMLSTVSSQQGESIPGVAYAVRIRRREKV
jgi:stage V sporulation protein AD